MKVLIQRVKQASVIVNKQEVASINHGLLLFVGICKDDDDAVIKKMAHKVANIRLFSDENDKMNLNINQVNGEILSVSQFTLCANHKKGNRPSFDLAKNPVDAKAMFEDFNSYLKEHDVQIQSGVFQEHMNVMINNDGPVTIHLDIEKE
jgi:D-tyrosyl-tRNA(Tyr) deacylase